MKHRHRKTRQNLGVRRETGVPLKPYPLVI